MCRMYLCTYLYWTLGEFCVCVLYKHFWKGHRIVWFFSLFSLTCRSAYLCLSFPPPTLFFSSWSKSVPGEGGGATGHQEGTVLDTGSSPQRIRPEVRQPFLWVQSLQRRCEHMHWFYDQLVDTVSLWREIFIGAKFSPIYMMGLCVCECYSTVSRCYNCVGSGQLIICSLLLGVDTYRDV